MSSLRRKSKQENEIEYLRKFFSEDMEEFSSKVSKDINKVKTDFKKLQSRVDGDMEELKQRISNIEKSAANMDLKINLLENKTKNGEVIWKTDKIDWRIPVQILY